MRYVSLLLTTLILLGAKPLIAQSTEQLSVMEILNPDGTLCLDRDGVYSLDGFVLHLTAKGRPIVTPKETTMQGGTGSWATSFGAANGANRPVSALAVYQGELYVGGEFTQAGGVAANYIARWNGTKWSALGTTNQNGVNGAVRAFAIYQGELYVGGEFTQAGGVAANYIARWNGTKWNTLGAGNQNGANYWVKAFAVYQGELYAGGDFTQVGGIQAKCIARWNGTKWNTVGTGNQNGVSSGGAFNPNVSALAVYQGELYVGGEFTQAGGVAANYIARWNGTKWNTLGAGNQNGVNSRVNALAVYNNELYVGGSFTQAGSIQANRIARWNGTKWNALGTGDQNGVSSDDATLTAVYALAVYQGELYVGGFFGQAGSVPASFIARWNGASWSALTTPTGNGVNSSVDALAVYGNSLFLGGALTLANAGENPIPSAYIAQWTFRN